MYSIRFYLEHDKKTTSFIEVIKERTPYSKPVVAIVRSITRKEQAKIAELVKLYFPYVHDSYKEDGYVDSRIPVDINKVMEIINRQD